MTPFLNLDVLKMFNMVVVLLVEKGKTEEGKRVSMLLYSKFLAASEIHYQAPVL